MERPRRQNSEDSDALIREYDSYVAGFSIRQLYEIWVHDEEMPASVRDRLSRTFTRPYSDEARTRYPFPSGCDDSDIAFNHLFNFGDSWVGYEWEKYGEKKLTPFWDAIRVNRRLRADIRDGLLFWLSQQEVALSEDDYRHYWTGIDSLVVGSPSHEQLRDLIAHHPMNPDAPFWPDFPQGLHIAEGWLLSGNEWTKQVAMEQILAQADHEAHSATTLDTIKGIKHLVLCAGLYRGTDDELPLTPDELTQLIGFLEEHLPVDDKYARMGDSAARLTDWILRPEVLRAFMERHELP